MASGKRTSYPSRQLRQGPAPLASFEDLSDEIESPTEKNSHSLPEIEEELKLYADSASPSTPRMLVATPSTPQADFSSASTPRAGINESWETNLDDACNTCDSASLSQFASKDSVLDSSREGFSYPKNDKNHKGMPQVNGIKNSVSSSFMDDVKGAEAASVLASSLPERSATPECLPQKAPTKKNSLTTSNHTSGQMSRASSRTPSPNSPRRFFAFFKHRDECSEPGSPSSPKSPRKSSFTNLFKIGGRDESDHSASSPTKRKGSLSIFFKGGKEGSKNRKPSTESTKDNLTSKGKKEASNRNMFSNLFRKDDRKFDKSPVKLTLQATSVDIPIELDLGSGTGWTSREISLHSHLSDLDDRDHVDDGKPDDDYTNDGYSSASIQVHTDPDDFSHTMSSDEQAFPTNDISPGISVHSEKLESVSSVIEIASQPQMTLISNEDGDISKEKSVGTVEDKISSGSEQESDFDPVSLKKRVMNEDYEAETLIDEENEYDEFPVNLEMITDASKKLPPTPLRRHRAVDVTTVPIERPRSSTPLNVTSLEAYIQSASPPPDRLTRDGEKLRVCLPGEEFLSKGKSPRKLAVKNWHEFCQEVLHSPRLRRKDDEPELFPRMPVTSSDNAVGCPTVASTSWVTFENVTETRKPRMIGLVHDKTAGLTESKTSKPFLFATDDTPPFDSSTELTDVNANSANLFQKIEGKPLFPSDNFLVSLPQPYRDTIATETLAEESSESPVDFSSFNAESTASFSQTFDTLDDIVQSTLTDNLASESENLDFFKTIDDDDGVLEGTMPSSPKLNSINVPSVVCNGSRKQNGSNHDWTDTSNRLSSSDSISSGDLPVRLDSLDGMDPLLDPASENECSFDEADKNCHKGITELASIQSKSVPQSEDMKRPDAYK